MKRGVRRVCEYLLYVLRPIAVTTKVTAPVAEAVNAFQPLGVSGVLALTTKMIWEGFGAFIATGWVIAVALCLFAVAGLRLRAEMDRLTEPRLEIVFDPSDRRFVDLRMNVKPLTHIVRLGVRNPTTVPIDGVRLKVTNVVTHFRGSPAHGVVPDGFPIYLRAWDDTSPFDTSTRTGVRLDPGEEPTYWGFFARANMSRSIALDHTRDKTNDYGLTTNDYGPLEITVEVTGRTRRTRPVTFLVSTNEKYVLSVTRVSEPAPGLAPPPTGPKGDRVGEESAIGKTEQSG